MIDSGFPWYNLGHAEKIQAEYYLHKVQIKSCKKTSTGQFMCISHHILVRYIRIYLDRHIWFETLLYFFWDTMFPAQRIQGGSEGRKE